MFWFRVSQFLSQGCLPLDAVQRAIAEEDDDAGAVKEEERVHRDR